MKYLILSVLMIVLSRSFASPKTDDRAQAATPPTQVVVVGGGLGGLSVLEELHRHGVTETILLESSSRVGGRVWTERGDGSLAGSQGQQPIYERGAELVNSSDHALRGLLSRFGIGLVPRKFKREKAIETFLFHERVWNHDRFEKRALRPYTMSELVSLMNQVPEDRSALTELERLENLRSSPDLAVREAATQHLRSTTASQLLEKSDLAKSLIRAFVQSEFGASLEQINAEVLLDYMKVTRVQNQLAIELIPGSDERYRIEGGSDLIIRKLSSKFASQIHTQSQVHRITENANGSFTVEFFDDRGREKRILADHVVFAAPASALKSITILSPHIERGELREAAEMPYASNAKVFLKFDSRFWNPEVRTAAVQAFQGVGVLESGVQFWDTSEDQTSKKGGVITLYPGDWPLDAAKQRERLDETLRQLEQHPDFTDLRKHLIGVDFQVWKESYPGVFNTKIPRAPRLFARKLKSNLYFAGADKDIDPRRDISPSFGYMEGAVRTATRVAERISHRIQAAVTLGGTCRSLFRRAD